MPQIQKEIVHKEKKLTTLQDKRGHIQEDIAELQTKLSEARQQGGNDARQRNEVFHYIMNHLKKKNIVQGNFLIRKIHFIYSGVPNNRIDFVRKIENKIKKYNILLPLQKVAVIGKNRQKF